MPRQVTDENRAPDPAEEVNQPPPNTRRSSSHGSRPPRNDTPQRQQPHPQPRPRFTASPYPNQHGRPPQQQQRQQQRRQGQHGHPEEQRLTQPQLPPPQVPPFSGHIRRHGRPQYTQLSGSAFGTARPAPRASRAGSRSVPTCRGVARAPTSPIHLSPPLRTSQGLPSSGNIAKHSISSLPSNPSTYGGQGGGSSTWPQTDGQPSLVSGDQPLSVPDPASGTKKGLGERSFQENLERQRLGAERRRAAILGCDTPEVPAPTDNQGKTKDNCVTASVDNADTTVTDDDDDLFSGLNADELDGVDVDALIDSHDPQYLQDHAMRSQPKDFQPLGFKEERFSPLARLKAPSSGSQLSLGSTRDDPIIIRSSSPFGADEPIVISSSRSPSPDDDEFDLSSALLKRQAERPLSEEDEPSRKRLRLQSPELEVRAGEDVSEPSEESTRTIADLLEALSLEVEDRAQLIGSAASLIKSFDDTEKEHHRIGRLLDLSSPLVLTREALETTLRSLANGVIRECHQQSATARLAVLIARGRLETATALVFTDFPGGKINIAKDEYFPAANTVSLVRAAHAALGLESTRPLCPKVTNTVIRESAAQDLFDNYDIAMNHLCLLASPMSLCVDFDLSVRLENDLVFAIAHDEDGHNDKSNLVRPYEELCDMSLERGAALGTFITHVWPSIEVVSFHQSSDKALPYCGLPIKHVVICRSGRFSPSLDANKRRGYLRDWQDKAVAVLLKEFTRADAVLAVVPRAIVAKGKKAVNERTESQTAVPIRSPPRVLDVSFPRSGPTWVTDDKVSPVDPSDYPPATSEISPRSAASALQTAQWIIHLGSFAKVSGGVSRKTQLHQALKRRVVEVADLREELDEPKLRVTMRRFLSGVVVQTQSSAVECECCGHAFRMDPVKNARPTVAPIANFLGAETETPHTSRGKVVQGKPSDN